MRTEPAGLARIRALVLAADHGKAAPIGRLLGARVLEVEPGLVRIQFTVKDDFMHPGGAVQGGIITAYTDMCMALAAHTLFEDDQYLSTSSLTANFLAPVTHGPVVGEGRVLRKGRSVVFLEATLRDAEGRPCAHATSVASIRHAHLTRS
jgi:uncharacterized protein (TIGR00369 family)